MNKFDMLVERVLEESFKRGDEPNTFIGYRCMRYDPTTGKAISGANSREYITLKQGMIIDYDEGHFITPYAQYAIDYYGVHDHNVLLAVQFNEADILSGDMDDRDPEISVSKSILKDFKTFEGE